jgi:type I pantothenate kinase
MTSVLTHLVERIKALPAPAMIGITGRVAVGKSTFAQTLATMLTANGSDAVVLNTDGYIYPTAQLEAWDLMSKKGRFQTHDLLGFLTDLDAWKRGDALSVPVYDH